MSAHPFEPLTVNELARIESDLVARVGDPRANKDDLEDSPLNPIEQHLGAAIALVRELQYDQKRIDAEHAAVVERQKKLIEQAERGAQVAREVGAKNFDAGLKEGEAAVRRASDVPLGNHHAGGYERPPPLSAHLKIEDFVSRPPMALILSCPVCHARHIDVGAFATKPHHTHACQTCGLAWRPAVEPTVGVQFLPGFKDKP